jgi:hypothetical protein
MTLTSDWKKSLFRENVMKYVPLIGTGIKFMIYERN